MEILQRNSVRSYAGQKVEKVKLEAIVESSHITQTVIISQALLIKNAAFATS